MVAKENQPSVRQDLLDFFEDTTLGQGEWQTYKQAQKGHGRREGREIWTSTQMNEWFEREWPGIAQIFENRRHYRRDVTLGEDACQVRVKGAPQTLAALNGRILAFMDCLGVSNVASQMRHFAAQPQEALQLLLGKLSRQCGYTKKPWRTRW